jgi:hypothetical protein
MLMLHRLILPAGLAAVILMACHGSTPSAAKAQACYPKIVRLQSRSFTIDITAGPKVPVYSIKNAAGQSLCTNLSLADLRNSHPELFNLVAPALAPTATASVAEPIISADDR